MPQLIKYSDSIYKLGLFFLHLCIKSDKIVYCNILWKLLANEYLLNGVKGIMKKIEDYIRTIPNFPEEGVMFRDISTVLSDRDGLRMAVDQMAASLGDEDFDTVVGPESRGFIFGVPIAYNMHKAFVPIRKKGKLPGETVSVEYDLEYGSAELEVHKDAIKPGDKVVIVDDLIATGGTTEAICKLIEKLGGTVVKIVFLIELEGLKGRDKLKNYNLVSIVKYPEK